ncbi:Relaxase/Mobilisation nuclease domain-containing protein [Paenimyroides ummariense]|uniref:Relaxase/Mobilisation nuclease domain-containing protein n=1 Tax=Paenimyroides ummariense TaxID=913024 RepID=A0A1I5CPK0_9FLAO|nr:conjugal transfer protein MobB [Paenimyroides ummariense]SFN88867.1 Relaxase/Mobilisation nuclease domain-containing protein [Paenimyroides ummariense]
MIAKIGKSANLYGALAYNNIKVDNEEGKILMINKMIETVNGQYSVGQLFRSFEPYLLANRNTEKHTVHISLNPDPKDLVSDDRFRQIAEEYMDAMGYGEQPFVVFKHTDIDRTHIHIVSVCVDEEGKKISDRFEKRRSMKVCRDLETKYGLISAIEEKGEIKSAIFKAVDYQAFDVKEQIASIVRHLPNYYQFRTLGTYNALLSLFNIAAEQVNGEIDGQTREGLVYFALDRQGEKVSNPFKSSLLGKEAGLIALQKHFEQSKERMKESPSRSLLSSTIETAMNITTNERDFKSLLIEQGINCVIRRNNEGRIYGITFIDHESRTVWNGSHLSKELSANTFNDYWNNNIKTERKEFVQHQSKTWQSTDTENIPDEKPHHLFDFLNSTEEEDILIEGLGALFIPEIQGEDYEELDFANRMKKTRKGRKQ